MVTITLDERDSAILEVLSRGEADVESLADSASCPPEYLRNRLPELADNGLVQRVDDRYTVTANGKRAIAGSPAGTMDDRIDTPAAVDREIQSFDLRPDREEAIRNAFAFLHYWGEAVASEIVDAVYSENPAGFESSEEWWTELVREHLADLPLVEPPESTGEPWRYSGTPTVDEVTEDGRLAPDDEPTGRTSVKFALEHSGLTEEERSAVRSTFELLVREGEASASAIEDRVYPDHDAGYDSAAEWWTDCVRDGLGSLPGVERADETGDVWQYRQTVQGPVSSGPEADVPDESLGPEDEHDE